MADDKFDLEKLFLSCEAHANAQDFRKLSKAFKGKDEGAVRRYSELHLSEHARAARAMIEADPKLARIDRDLWKGLLDDVISSAPNGGNQPKQDARKMDRQLIEQFSEKVSDLVHVRCKGFNI
jgi:hypothetical protein